MQICQDCKFGNPTAANFCQQCGHKLRPPVAVMIPAAQPIVALENVIARCREQLKALKEQIPAASNPAVAPLMGSLQAIPPEAQEARIAIIEALGKTREPVVLRSMLLVCGARGKEVRKAVALALAGIRHSLSAYILLPMLEDPSSRVRNVAIQALIVLEQPYCMDAIFAACCKSQTLRRITSDIIQRMQPLQKARFAYELNRLASPASDDERSIRQTLLRLCAVHDDTPQASTATQTQHPDRTAPSPSTSQSLPAESTDEHTSQNRLRPSQQNDDFVQETLPDKATLPGRPSTEALPDAAAVPAKRFDQERFADSLSENTISIRPMEDSVPEMPLTSVTGSSQTNIGFEAFQPSSDSFADLSFFESVSEDLETSSYSAHLLPNSDLRNPVERASGPTVSAASAFETHGHSSPQNHTTVGSPVPPAGANSASNSSLSAMHTSGASSIIRRAPAYSGVHRAPTTTSPRQWASPAAHSYATTPETPIYSPDVHGIPMPGYPPMAFHPGFSSASIPTMPTVPPHYPVAPLGTDLQPFAGVTPHISAAGNLVPSASATHHLTVPLEQSAVSHVATATAVSQPIALTTTVTSETASPESTAAEIARVSQEQNLQRLREMRDSVFKALVKTQTPVTGSTPRLVAKKVSALLTTPASDIPSVRKHLKELGDTQSPHVIETINSFCQKPSKEIRLACAEALGCLRHSSSAILLLKFLSDKSGTVTEAAVKSLGRLGLSELHPVLLAAGLINPSLRTVITAAVEGADEQQKLAWEQTLLTFAESRDADLAAFAISLLSRITEATHSELYERTVNSPEAAVRAASVDALVRTGKKKVIGLINEALVDSEAVVRRHAAAAVATICSPRSVELLRDLLQDEDVSVRRMAALTAGKIDEAELGAGIVQALEHETEPAIVELLLEALQRNAGQDGHSVLTRYVEGEAKQFREPALKALRRLKSPDSVPVFRRLLDDPSSTIRKQSVEHLTAMKVTACLPRLRELLRTDPDENVRAVCARGVGELRDENAPELLEGALEDHSTVRFQAIVGLGKLGNPSAGPSLLSLLNDVQPEIRYQAVKALGQLRLEGCEERIEPLLHDADQMVRRGAEQTLLALGLTPRQISSTRFRRRLTKLASMITPSQLMGALPGRGSSLAVVAGLMIMIGGTWILSNLGSFVSGSSTLPVFRVESVRISSAADLAVVWRKDLVLDVIKSSTGELQARVRAPVATRDVVIDNQGGVILSFGKNLQRLSSDSSFEPDKALTKELAEKPLASGFHAADNLYCVFMPKGAETRLELLNAVTLDQVESYTLKGRFDGRCLVSPDKKMALSLGNNGLVAIAEIASGEVFQLDISTLLKGGSVGTTMAVQFSRDMKHFCVCTTSSLFIFSVEKLALEKQVQETGGFFTVTSTEDGTLRAISARGKIVEVSPDLNSVTEKTIDTDFDLVDVDPGGQQIIMADSEARDAEIFDISQSRIVTKIKGE